MSATPAFEVDAGGPAIGNASVPSVFARTGLDRGVEPGEGAPRPNWLSILASAGAALGTPAKPAAAGGITPSAESATESDASSHGSLDASLDLSLDSSLDGRSATSSPSPSRLGWNAPASAPSADAALARTLNAAAATPNAPSLPLARATQSMYAQQPPAAPPSSGSPGNANSAVPGKTAHRPAGLSQKSAPAIDDATTAALAPTAPAVEVPALLTASAPAPVPFTALANPLASMAQAETPARPPLVTPARANPLSADSPGSFPHAQPSSSAASQPSIRQAPAILPAPTALNADTAAGIRGGNREGAWEFGAAALPTESSSSLVAENSASSSSPSAPSLAGSAPAEGIAPPSLAGSIAKADHDSDASAVGQHPAYSLDFGNSNSNGPNFDLNFSTASAEPAAVAESGAPHPGETGPRSALSASALHSAQVAGGPESASHPAQIASGPPMAAQLESAAVAHGDGTAQRPPAASVPTTTTPALQEPFTALDAHLPVTAAGAANSPTWTRSGAHSVEAGFEDPGLGWVGVRADLAAGQVHAALVPSSADAAQALGSQMSGLHAYLNDQRTPLSSLTLAAPTSSAASSGPDPGTAGNQQNPQQDDSTPAFASSNFTAGERAGNAVQPPEPIAPVPFFERAGAYISVLA